MKNLAELVNGFHPLNIFAKKSILDVRQSSEYASETNNKKQPGKLRDTPSEFKRKISQFFELPSDYYKILTHWKNLEQIIYYYH